MPPKQASRPDYTHQKGHAHNDSPASSPTDSPASGPVSDPTSAPTSAPTPAPASGPMDGVWEDEEEGTLPGVGAVGEASVKQIRIGGNRAIIVVENRGPKLCVRNMWLNRQDPELAERVVQMVRDRYLSPARPVILEVDGAEPALLGALDGVPAYWTSMLKYIGEDAKPSLWALSRPELMRGEEAESFFASSEESLVRWAKDIAISLGDPEEDAEADARRVFRQAPESGVGTTRHYFFSLKDGNDEKVAELWLRLAEDRLSYSCHNI